MYNIKRKIQNQTVGLIPILLFMLLDNFFSYKLSFIIAVVFCVVCLLLYRALSKDKVYQFLLLPSAATFILYALFLLLDIKSILFVYTPLLVEVLLVLVLSIMSFSKRMILRRLRHSSLPTYRRTMVRTALDEFYFLVQIVQSVYTLHLFVVLVYTMLPEDMKGIPFTQFLYRDLGIIIGLLIVLYEQIRIFLMKGNLKKEMWLPVLDNQGKVIGCIARSVSRSTPKKYYHPIVRVAIVYKGMLYLQKRRGSDYVSPDTLDYPYHGYVLFRQSTEQTIKDIIGDLHREKDIKPRYLVRYTYEDEKVKHLVSLYTICLRTEEQFDQFRHYGGKLWTSKQIDENLEKGIFSSYFESEYPYLKNTVLFAEKFCRENKAQEESE